MPVVIPCPRCGAKNRVDPDRSVSAQPVCGRCGERLDVGAAGSAGAQESFGNVTVPVVLTDDTFVAAVRRAGPKPILVDCWAPWCGPCRAIAPMIDQLAAESAGRYVVAKLNTEENPNVAAQLNIRAIPTLLIFKDSELVDRIEGAAPKHMLAQRLARFV